MFYSNILFYIILKNGINSKVIFLYSAKNNTLNLNYNDKSNTDLYHLHTIKQLLSTTDEHIINRSHPNREMYIFFSYGQDRIRKLT